MLDEIQASSTRRPLNPDTVEKLKTSIQRLGLQTPISVRETPNHWELVTGHHRLSALKELGFTETLAVLFDNETDARLWEISENLHRSELTVLERAQQIAEWIALTEEKQNKQKLAQLAPVSTRGGRGVEGGIRASARELGVNRREAERSIKVASITPEAQQAAITAGIEDNQSKLLEVAKVAPDQQVTKVKELAAPPFIAFLAGVMAKRGGDKYFQLEQVVPIESRRLRKVANLAIFPRRPIDIVSIHQIISL